MATGAALLVTMSTAGAAAPGTATSAPAREKRSLGCGAGVVELTWSSDVPVGLIVFSSNSPAGAHSTVAPVQTGSHSYTSGRHTLSWAFVDETGDAARPESHAACQMRF
jgi:hypothetical protein